MAPDHRSQPPKNKLQEWFPNTKLPIIISAPMKGVATGTLAGQVSKAGGFGKFVPTVLTRSWGEWVQAGRQAFPVDKKTKQKKQASHQERST